MNNLFDDCNIIEAYLGYKTDTKTFDLELSDELINFIVVKLKKDYKYEQYFSKKYYYKNMIYISMYRNQKNYRESYKFINLGQTIVKHNDDLHIFYGQNLKIPMNNMDFPCKLNYHYIDEQNTTEFTINERIKVYVFDGKIKFEVFKINKHWANDIKKFKNLITLLVK